MPKIELADGRMLEFSAFGSDEALPLVLHHPTPTAPRSRPLSRRAVEAGFRLIVPVRPGYGASTPAPGRRVADIPIDITFLLDALGVERFVTLGIAGGGPYALACAAHLPDRCLAVATIAGFAPSTVTGPGWFKELHGASAAEFRAAAEGPVSLTRLLEASARRFATTNQTDLKMAVFSQLSEVDRDALHGELADCMATCVREASTSGLAGWRDDDLAYVSDWGFEPAKLGVPLAVWHGELDRVVSIDHGYWIGREIPGADTNFLTGDGHISVLRHFEAVLGRLRAAAERRGPTF